MAPRYAHIGRRLRSRPALWALGIAVAVALFVAAVVVVPPMMATYDGVTADARAQAVASARQSLLFLGGGLLAGLTLLFTWRRDTLTRDANFTGRYTEAITQLGHDSIAVRLGGVYALERIARDSTRDRGTILDVLAAYLRHHSRIRKDGQRRALSVDLSAAALVVGRITQMSSPQSRVDLSNTNLRGADLTGANLKRALLSGSDLGSAKLAGADLSHAVLGRANLSHAKLAESDLRWARAARADLTAADMSQANARRANFRDAKMAGTNLWGADLSAATLTAADLSGADFTKTSLLGANFAGANLTNADVIEADFSQARNLNSAVGVLRDSSPA